MANLPTSLTLNLDGKAVAVPLPAAVDAKVTLKEWDLLDSLAWDDFNSCSPGSPDIIGGACWSWSVCEGAGLGRGGGGVVASLMKKGLVNQNGYGADACVGFTRLGWITWLAVRNSRIALGARVRTA